MLQSIMYFIIYCKACRLEYIQLTETTAKAALGSVAASTIGRTVSQVLVGRIPGFGNAINAATAAGLTESMG